MIITNKNNIAVQYFGGEELLSLKTFVKEKALSEVEYLLYPEFALDTKIKMIHHLNKYGESLKEDVPIQNLLEFVFLYERNIEGLMEYAKECSVNPLEKVFEWLKEGRIQYIKDFGFVMYF